MKTIKAYAALAILLFVIVASGCAREKKEMAGGTVNPYATPLPNYPPGGCFNGVCPSATPVGGCAPTPTPFVDGASATLTVDSQAVLRSYVGSPINDPQTITLNVNLRPIQITNEIGTYRSFGG